MQLHADWRATVRSSPPPAGRLPSPASQPDCTTPPSPPANEANRRRTDRDMPLQLGADEVAVGLMLTRVHGSGLQLQRRAAFAALDQGPPRAALSPRHPVDGGGPQPSLVAPNEPSVRRKTRMWTAGAGVWNSMVTTPCGLFGAAHPTGIGDASHGPLPRTIQPRVPAASSGAVRIPAAAETNRRSDAGAQIVPSASVGSIGHTSGVPGAGPPKPPPLEAGAGLAPGDPNPAPSPGALVGTS
jgi:hypothetical protein